MKKLFLLFVFVLLTFSKSFPQWSTDPNNNLIVGYGLNPDLCSDSAGGCYLTYEYETTGYPRKLAVERIDKYGYKPWGTLKQIQGELPEQWQAELIEDGEGGVLVSYEDNEWIPPSTSTTRVRMQRVDSSGSFLWGPTGVRVTTEEINHGVQAIVSDGEGGCVVVWPNQLPNCTYEYRANRINNLGEIVWSDTGIFIENNINSERANIVRASDGHYYVQIRRNLYRIRENGEILRRDSVTLGYPIPDPERGVVLSGKTGTLNNIKLVAQRKDSLGNNLWQEPYVEIADSLYINTVLRIQYSNGHYYYGWSGTKDGIVQLSQFQALRQDGSKLFPQSSLKISENSPIGSPHIIPSESGRTIIIWNDATISSSSFAQMYDTLGNKLWAENGIVVSYPAITVQTVTDGQGGFITCGSINQFTIVVQQMSQNGNLGEVLSVPVELISFTGIADNDKITLNWITATELNNYGFEIERLKDYKIEKTYEWEKIGFIEGHGTTTETNSYSFVDSDLLSGKVKYRLKQIDFDGSYEFSDEIEVDVDITPKEFILHQNFPNPFNSSTIIKYALKTDGIVALKVYNAIGEEIRTLINEYKTAGNYETEFNAGNLSSVVYIYKLQAGDFVSSKKMILLK